MKNIKSKIIRFFGGMTKEDTANAFLLGRRSVLIALKLKMKEQYGKDADDWCKELYSFVEKLAKRNDIIFQ